MKHLPVLIVGAGPTGLMMACELARHGIPLRIIDKKAEPTKGSNATWIQTRTLEIFDAIGMIAPFLKIGHQCNAINFYEKGKQLSTISLNQLDSIYPFILMVPQSETEQLLIKRLTKYNIYIERSSEMTDVKQTKTGVISTVCHANGNIENIKSAWLIACDGANSTVRKKCAIKFPGEAITEQFMVADAQMDSYLSTDEIHVFFDKGNIFPDRATIFSAFPWGITNYRLSANLYQSYPRQNFTEQEVREIVAERTYGNYIVNSVSWISPFWIHGKIVKRLYDNFIFFAGDAAHIHSPAGGQGMNTGIQDAFNLAWKLALVIKSKANRSLLDSYQSERYPVDNNIVKNTEYLTKMVIFDKSFFRKLKQFGNKILKHPYFSKEIGRELTQLKIRYKNSPIINYKKNLLKKHPKQGERAPDILIDNKRSLYSYFHHTLHTVLIFYGNNPSKNSLTKIKALQKLLNETFSRRIKIFFIMKEGTKNKKEHIDDINGKIHQRYQVTKSTIYVIRPDNYIGYCSDKLTFNDIKKFLERCIN